MEDAHWNYYVFRNQFSQIVRQYEQNKQTVTEEEINQLPAHFRDELNAKEEEEALPKIANPMFIHNAQHNLYMPPDERNRINLLLKIDNPPENKDEEE